LSTTYLSNTITYVAYYSFLLIFRELSASILEGIFGKTRQPSPASLPGFPSQQSIDNQRENLRLFSKNSKFWRCQQICFPSDQQCQSGVTGLALFLDKSIQVYNLCYLRKYFLIMNRSLYFKFSLKENNPYQYTGGF